MQKRKIRWHVRVLIAMVAVLLCQFALLAVSQIGVDNAELASNIDRLVPGGGAVWTAAADIVMPDSVIYARRVISPEFTSTLILKPNHRVILAGGHVGCTASETFNIEATITQESTGAVAVGYTQGFCTGERQIWDAIAPARGPAQFEVGPALACGLLRTRLRGQVTDSFQWCKNVTLVSSP